MSSFGAIRRRTRPKYNVTHDPMELRNLAGSSAHATIEARLKRLLAEQRELKRLRPVSGSVPGQP